MKQPSLNILQDGKVTLYLPMAQFNKQRFIGNIDWDRKTFYSSPKKKSIHVFRSNNSLAMPYELIYKKKKRFIYICITLDNKKLWTSVLTYKKYGTVLNFSKQGFETQIFLELSKFKRSKNKARTERKNLLEGV